MNAHEEGISNADFGRLRRLIYETSGITLSADKKTMLELRIRRRLRSLAINSYAQYCGYLFGRQGRKDELVHLIDVVTTNKTDFFREPGHFEYLTDRALPALAARYGAGKPVFVWSAGCSSGEEPYTLAIVLSEYGLAHPGFQFRVLGTDISTAMLEKAQWGVYSCDMLRPVPSALQRKYFMRSRDPSSRVSRLVPELRRLVEFRRLNFMEADYGLTEMVEAIFCRNVIIYFDRATQEQILRKLTRQILPGGYIFVGHAESLHDMHLPLEPVAPALYRKIDAAC